MARGQGQPDEQKSVAPQRFADTTPQVFPGSDYSFTLQAVMELQSKVAQLTEAVSNLSKKVEKHDEKLDHATKVIYAAGVVLTIAMVVGGWVVNRVADVAVEIFKHPVQVQQIQPFPAPPQGK
jgi:hypothetical protein